tara:strand:- start:364 stop:987 length:624 start_codon:yes stop_codon:yes gene_type:complete
MVFLLKFILERRIMNKLYVYMLSLLFVINIANAEEGKFRLGVEGGWSPVELEAEDTAQAIANALGETVTTEYDTGVFIGRLFGKYGLSSNVDFEVGYFQTSSADATYKAASGKASESYDVSGLDLSAVFKSEEGFFGKIGMHSSTVDGAAKLIFGSTSVSATGSADGSGMLFGAGVEIDNVRYGVTRYNGVGGIDTDLTYGYVGFIF